MVKYLFITVMLFVAALSFSQQDLGLSKDNGVLNRKIFIANDGTFVILADISSGLKTIMTRFDASGKQQDMKKISVLHPEVYDPARKFWYQAIVWKGKVVIYCLNEAGELSETEIKNDQIEGNDNVMLYLSESKGMELHLSHFINPMKGKKMPYLIVEYNPVGKSYEIADCKNIQDPMDNVMYVGTKGEKRYYVCSALDKKASKTNFTLLESGNTEIKSIPLASEAYSKATKMVVLAAMIHPLNAASEDLYFKLNGNDGTTDVYFFRLTPDGELSKIKFSSKEIAKGSFPIYFSEEGKETIFTVKDDWNNRILISTDFESQDAETSFEAGGYNDLYEIGNKEDRLAFKICENEARMVTIDIKGNGKLYVVDLR